jgi:hypothetical protein
MLTAVHTLDTRYKTYLGRAVALTVLYSLGYVVICRACWTSSDVLSSLLICGAVLFLFTVILSIEIQAQIEPYQRSSHSQAVNDDSAIFTPLFINIPTRLGTVNLILIFIHAISLATLLPYISAFLVAFLTGGAAKR